MNMKIGVTGSRGRIGSRLVALGAVPLDFDVTDREAIERELSVNVYDVIIHTASMSSIQECEQDLNRAIEVNYWGTHRVCEMAVPNSVLLLSTEQVFDGKKGLYSEEDEPFPINNYGRTKLAAEMVVKSVYGGKVIRLSRGISRETGKDIDNYINALRKGEEINVPDFIWRSYCHLDFLAEGVWAIANNFRAMPNYIHLGGSYPLSFYELMVMVAESLNLDPWLVVSRKTEIKDSPRPYNCGFDISLATESGIQVYSPHASVRRLAREYETVQS